MNRYYLYFCRNGIEIYKNDGTGNCLTFKDANGHEFNYFKTKISFNLDEKYFEYIDDVNERFVNNCSVLKPKSVVCGRSYDFVTKLRSFIEIILIDYIKDDNSEIVFVIEKEVIVLIEKYTKNKYAKVIKEIMEQINSNYKDQDCNRKLLNVFSLIEGIYAFTNILSARYHKNVAICHDMFLLTCNMNGDAQLFGSVDDEIEEDDEALFYSKFLKSVTYPLSSEIKESLYGYIGTKDIYAQGDCDLIIADEKFTFNLTAGSIEEYNNSERLKKTQQLIKDTLPSEETLIFFENVSILGLRACENLVKEGRVLKIDGYTKNDFNRDIFKYLDYVVDWNRGEILLRHQQLLAKVKSHHRNDVLNKLYYSENNLYFCVPLLTKKERRDFFHDFGITEME